MRANEQWEATIAGGLEVWHSACNWGTWVQFPVSDQPFPALCLLQEKIIYSLERYLWVIAYNFKIKNKPWISTNSYYAEPLVSFTNSMRQLLVKTPILLKHISQKPILHYGIHTVLSVDADIYLGSSHKYTQVHMQYLYRAISHDSYVP